MRALILMVCFAAALVGCSRSVSQKDFASPEEAAQALVAAAKAKDTHALLEVLGADAQPVIDSGDPVRDQHARERFLHAYEAGHSFDSSAEGVATLQVGSDKWPFPFPIQQHGARWSFDSSAGAEEIVNRRVGENELDAIQACLAFVDAEREYYIRNPQGQPLLQYAQKIASTEGSKDGLYWPTTGDEPQSPLGVKFARARSEGYFEKGVVVGQGYRGYIYRLLTAQGPRAAGGAYDYLVNGKMIGGFALLAFPVEYGNSGVMSFIVNHDGVVYSKDLGADTAKAADGIAAFDPDSSWKREAAIEPARQADAQ
jgi:Protein of unknown function (DUF2950)